jgi:hypothetical protein
VGRRNGKAGGASASAIEELIGRRAQTLYTLAEKVQALADARAAVQAAQEAERAAYAVAVQAQEAVVSAGWSVQELRDADLYVAAPPVRRRRTTTPTSHPDAGATTEARSTPDAASAEETSDASAGEAVA